MPSKPSSSRSSPVRCARLSVAGQLVERRHEDVGGHDRLHAGRDRRAERDELHALQGFEIRPTMVGSSRCESVAGRAVTGEVLRAGGDAAALEPGHERRDVPRDELRVRAEGADADDRVAAGSS